MPRTARPLERDCTLAILAASTAGWRVPGLVTPVQSFSFVVVTAQAPISTNGSAERDWLSMNICPSQPSASTACACAAELPETEPPARQNSTMRSPLLVSLLICVEG